MKEIDTRAWDHAFRQDSIKLIQNITISIEENFKLEIFEECLVKPIHNTTISHEKYRHKGLSPESFWIRLYQTSSQYYNFTWKNHNQELQARILLKIT